jgi:hypothetical protein
MPIEFTTTKEQREKIKQASTMQELDVVFNEVRK